MFISVKLPLLDKDDFLLVNIDKIISIHPANGHAMIRVDGCKDVNVYVIDMTPERLDDKIFEEQMYFERHVQEA